MLRSAQPSHLTRLLLSPGYPVGVDRRCQRGLLDGPWPHAGRGSAGTGDAGGSVDLDSGEDVEGVLGAARLLRAVVRGLVPGQEYFLAQALSALDLDVQPRAAGVRAVQGVSELLRSDALNAPSEPSEIGLGAVLRVNFYRSPDRQVALPAAPEHAE
jgi:hypothetical protein